MIPKLDRFRRESFNTFVVRVVATDLLAVPTRLDLTFNEGGSAANVCVQSTQYQRFLGPPKKKGIAQFEPRDPW